MCVRVCVWDRESNPDKEITQRRKNSNCRNISDLMRLLFTLILCFIHRKMSILISMYNKITHFMILYAFVFRSSLQIKSSKYRNKSDSVRNFMRNIERYWSYWLSIKKFQRIGNNMRAELIFGTYKLLSKMAFHAFKAMWNKKP